MEPRRPAVSRTVTRGLSPLPRAARVTAALLAAPEALAADVLALIGPTRDERRRAAQRPRLTPGAVAEAMRRHGR
jgi:hypothetical protein